MYSSLNFFYYFIGSKCFYGNDYMLVLQIDSILGPSTKVIPTTDIAMRHNPKSSSGDASSISCGPPKLVDSSINAFMIFKEYRKKQNC